MKKFTISLLSFLVFIPIFVLAAMPPSDKECVQRGYEMNVGDNIPYIPYCVFPDGSKCPIEDFNKGICGAEFKIEDYCVKKGVPVWDKDKCCSGLRPDLSWGKIGQATCQPIFKIIYNPYFWPVLVVIGFLIFWLIKKLIKKKKI